MAGAVVSASKGAMDSVLAKLKDMVFDTGASILGIPKDIMSLKEELLAMNALLEKLEGNEQPDPQVKNWRNEVLEMTYDIEDCIDDFNNNMTSFDARASLISKVSKFIRDRFDTAMQIKELKARLQEISDRRKRYKLDDCTSSATIEPLDPRLPALYNEATSLVGIDNPKEDIIKWLLDEDQPLKVVSIVGTGGLGKTTLANEVYREVGGRFICKALVPVSRTPDMRRLLTSMIYSVENRSQLLQQDEQSHVCDEQYLIGRLRKYLHDKRYLIIVDDLWNVPPWKIIKCAFPENNQQSRVIVTTRHRDVARACCTDDQYIHDMSPLSDANSKTLFLKRLSISEDDSRFQNSETVLCQILKKCGGLPLAIITIASILACQQFGTLKQQWEWIQNSLIAQSEADPSLQDMVHILDLSYKSLPHHLKSSFLYLGKYPEDRDICRVELVRQWVAEGFVTSSPRRDAWDVAEGYFNGLVNRSMIQPIYASDFSNEVLYCRVHDMMLDLILRRCGEDNFITMVRGPQQEVAEVQYKVRRLSINMSAEEHATMTGATTGLLSQVRSLSMFGGTDWMPPLLEFRFIRVLLLEFHKPVEMTIDLTCIIQMSQLRYLKIRLLYAYVGTIIVLPSQIQRLQYLETLQLPSLDYCLPSDIVDLPRLSHLIVTSYARLPDGIGKLNQLRTLNGFSLQKSSLENIKALGALTNLVDLKLHSLEEGNSESMVAKTCALSSALENLSYLKKIRIPGIVGRQRFHGFRRNGLSSLSPTFHNLEELRMYHMTLSRVPRWIGSLRNLRKLDLGLDEISNSSWKEDVSIIGTLPSLIFLILDIGCVLAERIVISHTMGFAALKLFRFDCDRISRLSFEAGAMPNLRMLSLYFDPHEWDEGAPAGLEHLPSLKEIAAGKAGPHGEGERLVTSQDGLIRRVFEEAVGALPTHPAFTFRENEVCISRPRREPA